jgi:acetyltransferase-like isoleucine patch superfamily enzyme
MVRLILLEKLDMMKNISVEDLQLGKNVVISPSAVIRGLNGPAKRVKIGDNTYIGDNVQIIVDDFEIGDYCKVHHHTNLHGYLPLTIGHNAWIGQYSIIDSVGGTTIGNNCGIGAHSQLWSHILYGDELEGCNYNSRKPLIIGNDCWFVGHCIVSPITAKDKSMALVGSVITKDMEENHIYGGSPARDLTGKIPSQFKTLSTEEKYNKMMEHYLEFGSPSSIKIITDESLVEDEKISYFNVNNRTYTKRSTAEEIDFMKFLLPTRAKFIPS